MWIHTVTEGETLRSIAEQYSTTTRELEHFNELQTEEVLVPGQHLLVPSTRDTLAEVYVLRRGDNVARVARKAGVSQTELERWLGIRPAPGSTDSTQAIPGYKSLVPWNTGSAIAIPKLITQKRAIEVNGYLLPQGNASDARIVQEVGERLTYLCIFSYQAKADGTLTPQPDSQAVSATKTARVQPLMTVTNFDGTQFNTELAHTLMANSSLRRKLIQSTVTMARQRGFSGVNVDFEHMRPTDRPLYNTLIRELGAACRRQGLSISIAMGPKTSDSPTASWMGAFDYKTLGAEVDFLMLMTYEWGWVGGPPMTTIMQCVDCGSAGLVGFGWVTRISLFSQFSQERLHKNKTHGVIPVGSSYLENWYPVGHHY
ncbi:LysM peptidoglycan-binding domain-containing protein [Alicyclobacillus curvatus]|nr:LysM peptidoglycan-binding domain-containing protein [Alicyclobacillus curvatus]